MGKLSGTQQTVDRISCTLLVGERRESAYACARDVIQASSLAVRTFGPNFDGYPWNIGQGGRWIISRPTILAIRLVHSMPLGECRHKCGPVKAFPCENMA